MTRVEELHPDVSSLRHGGGSGESVLESALRKTFPAGLSGLIFDCDGVLVDSKDANIGYYNRLLEELGHPHMPESLVDYVQMASAEQAFDILFQGEARQEIPRLTRLIPYRSFSLPLLRLEPGMRELLEWLGAQGIRLGVHTNRGSGMWDVLDRFSLRGVFDPVMTVDVVEPKPSPEGVRKILAAWNLDSSRVGFVGDSATDAGAAGACGVPLLGYRNKKLPAAVHVDDFSRLRNALRGVIRPSVPDMCLPEPAGAEAGRPS